ncbi:MAG TPA: hypothetical protein P5077_11745, partial [bacterium]|nr:hypothetical protein [bacterium]
DCADGNACNGEELCDDLGRCNAGEPLVCADDNACTDDQCDPSAGCQYIDDDTNICDDGNELTENDACFEGDCNGELMTGICGNAIPVGALPYTTTGTTTGRPDSLTVYGAACPQISQASGDIVYELTVENGVKYQIQVTPETTFDAVINLIGACGESEMCFGMADDGAAGAAEILLYAADHTGTVHIVIEGNTDDETGSYEINVAIYEQPDDDTVEPDDILPDEAVTDETLVDEIVVDEEEPDEMVIDDVATDDILIDKEETDDAPVILDDGSPLVDDTVTPDDAAPADKDSAVPDNETPDEATDTLVGDEDELLTDTAPAIDTDKPADNGCGCSLVF